MDAHRGEFRVVLMCRVLEASRSGFYDWRKRRDSPSRRATAQSERDQLVRAVFLERKERYGAPRLTRELRGRGHCHNEKTIQASMQRQTLVAKAGRKFKATTNSKHDLPVAPNRLNQHFSATAPSQKWVGDITYLWSGEGWLYLAVVIDLYSRAVVGWAMSDRMKAVLVCDALRMALWRRGFPKGVIVHSDRGIQYCSGAYQYMINDHKLLCNMSAKGNCYDNAAAESFFHSLKVEAIHGEYFPTRDSMRQTVFEYIEVDYNRDRQHSANGYLSPAAFEMKTVA